jgi:hypothetical protein
VTYPGIADDIKDILKTMLGEEVYMPVANVYRKILCSSPRASEQSMSHEKHQTPKYLHIITSPKDE